MNMTSFFQRTYKQKAVYWSTPAADGYGGFTFASPVEIDCRWEDKQIVVTNDDGKEITTSSQVFTESVVDKEGYLYLGTLDNLTVAQKANPKLVEGAYSIVRVTAIPKLGSNSVFVRKIFLSWRLY